ncbi:MAG: cobaltochelatase subunit CobN [Geminicoccaceae bacterium]|nr:MAG: cobaltochelatase subunit CobN [Geminicoccaceae bacterium]
MHLLNAAAVEADSTEPVDLGQTPGELVVLSAAETELAVLAAAQRRLGAGAPSLRLANLLKLQHPYSVDLYVDAVVAKARYVVVRLLGGRAYWPYGVERLAEVARSQGIAIAFLPGDDRADPDLADWSTVPADELRRLWLYLVHGGPDNASSLLAYLAERIGRPSGDWREPAPLVTAGLHHDSATASGPNAAIVFYRALLQAGNLEPIEALTRGLEAEGFGVRALFATSLKDAQAAAITQELLAEHPIDVVVNLTGFALGGGRTLLDDGERVVLQATLASGSRTAWDASSRGLTARDLAMQVALTEVDGRVFSRAVAFREAGEVDPGVEAPLARHLPDPERCRFVAKLARGWSRLRRTAQAERKVALILANYPNKDGRLANGVGLDTPESAVVVLEALQREGYALDGVPASAAELMARLREGPTNALEGRNQRTARITLDLADYRTAFEALPEAFRRSVTERWGAPEADPHVEGEAFVLALLPFGNAVLGIQPSRGYHIDPEATYHSPDLAPPHGYLAFYLWLRSVWGAHAVVHLGKHGNLEWLPGKALALSAACAPEAVLGPLPQLYPFIVNDPGEGSQAKRRTSAVVVDHLTPPLARAEAHGAYAELEQLVDEYYQASGLDARRAEHLRREIAATTARLGLDQDLGLDLTADDETRLSALDNHLCELKELQIRDGLHIFGRSPEGPLRSELLTALVRTDRGTGTAERSLLMALAADLGLERFDALTRELATPYDGPRPEALASQSNAPWRTAGDTVERLELLAHALVAGELAGPPDWPATAAVLTSLHDDLAPALDRSGAAEIEGLLRGLDGRFVAPGPSGAPTRGRPDVLPTGRNFYSVDSRAVPTPAAWQLGWRSAEAIIQRYVQDEGMWPRTVALSAWGTANMRTGGDDIAQALALLGVRPRWDGASHRVVGTEIMPLTALGRPRVDVTLRISGFFRDAFPAQVALVDQAVQAVARLDEPPDQNPIAAKVQAEAQALERDGLTAEAAFRRASFRVFGAKPGAYGAGLQALIDEGGWSEDADLARAFVAWGGWAYGGGRAEEGAAAADELTTRLAGVELVLHNQDNREHDLLDSDDYYQFEGGLTAAVRTLSGTQPTVFHNDHSRPEHLKVRRLEEELSLIVRGRATNPKWLEGVMRHGYKGAFEIAATVDYLFAFAATTRLVGDHHFDALWDAYLEDDTVRTFLEHANPAALDEIRARFEEAQRRGLWHPRRNLFHPSPASG